MYIESEHIEQCNLIHWWAVTHKMYQLPEVALFAIPNGGARHIAVANKLKAEGVRAGVPDLFLAAPRGQHAGLFIELKKTKGGAVSAAQKETIRQLQTLGYACKVCKGWEQARVALDTYLKGEEK